MNERKKNDQINLIDFLIKCKEWAAFLLKKWKIILIAGIIGAASGFLYAYYSKPIYTARLTFAMEGEESNSLGSALGLASQFGIDLGTKPGGAFSGANIIELFKSRTMIEKTLLSSVSVGQKKISLAEFYIQNARWRDVWVKSPTLKNVQFLPDSNMKDFTRQQDSILGVIYSNISTGELNVFQKERSVQIVTIEMKSGNEDFAKYFTEALATNVSEFYVSNKNYKAQENLGILKRQTDSIRVELNSSIMGVASATDDVFNLNPALNVKRVPSSRRQVDVQANGAMLGELIKQLELAKVALRKETPLIQIIDHPVFPLQKEKFGKSKGIIIGGFIAAVLTMIFLLLHFFYVTHLAVKKSF